jgi:hypothetical protein
MTWTQGRRYLEQSLKNARRSEQPLSSRESMRMKKRETMTRGRKKQVPRRLRLQKMHLLRDSD